MAQQLRPDRAWGLRPSTQYDTPADPTTSLGSGVWGQQTGEISTPGHQFSCLSLPLRQPVVLLPRRVEVPHPAPEPSVTLVRWSATLACSGSAACHPPAVSATPPRQPPPPPARAPGPRPLHHTPTPPDPAGDPSFPALGFPSPPPARPPPRLRSAPGSGPLPPPPPPPGKAGAARSRGRCS